MNAINYTVCSEANLMFIGNTKVWKKSYAQWLET